MLAFDGVLTVYAFSVSDSADTAASAVLDEEGQRASPVCTQRLTKWHASTTAMSFHAGEQCIPCLAPFLHCGTGLFTPFHPNFSRQQCRSKYLPNNRIHGVIPIAMGKRRGWDSQSFVQGHTGGAKSVEKIPRRISALQILLR